MEEPLAATASGKLVHLILDPHQEESEISRLRSPDKEERRKAAAALANKGSMEAASKIETMILEGGIPKEIRQDMGRALISMSFKHAGALSEDLTRKSRRMNAISMAIRTRF
jgi:hypothetical protein